MELGLAAAGHDIGLLCELSSAAQSVLRQHFPHARLTSDVRRLDRLPEADIVTAGFPCQDLSQAGRGKGIGGENSGLVREVFRLLACSEHKPRWLVFENVPFMLSLHRGAAMRYVVDSLEALGYAWAYRVVDARAFGVPQRRRRVLLLASHVSDPRPVLLGEDAGESPSPQQWNSGRGFYWTEGNTGLGWAPGAIPTLKGGSGLGIASPPAIWFPGRRSMELPDIRDAERLQGFEPGWTAAVETGFTRGERWRLVGNAVCVPMMRWLAARLEVESEHDPSYDREWDPVRGWPDAAWGHQGSRRMSRVSAWPVAVPRQTIIPFLRYRTHPLSLRATEGFLRRARKSSLRFEKGFLEDVAHHAERMRTAAVG